MSLLLSKTLELSRDGYQVQLGSGNDKLLFKIALIRSGMICDCQINLLELTFVKDQELAIVDTLILLKQKLEDGIQ